MNQIANGKAAPWIARFGYFLLPALAVCVLKIVLSQRSFPGQLVYPPHFNFFRSLYYWQEGLLVGLVIALTGVLAARLPRRWLRFAIYFPVALWAVWLVVWVMVRAQFSIELSPRYAVALLLQPSAINGIGLGRPFFYAFIAFSFAIMFAMSAAGAYLSGRLSRRFIDVVALLALGIFLLVHVPVRAWVAYQVNRSQHAVLALDDWSPVALQSEYLIPGLRAGRPTLPNLEDPARTRAYVEWMKHLPRREIPRKIDIVWIVVEAFRADAINEKITPHLWGYADRFQLKLDRNHWSGGNASQFGLFAMFTGLAGYHLQTFVREEAQMPFFNLLAQNGYRLRIADQSYFQFARFPLLLPPSIMNAAVHEPTADKNDAAMTDAFLADMKSRPAVPALDIVTFDAPHWPFAYAAEDDICEPAASAVAYPHFTRTAAEAAAAFNGYRNACHGVDRQIGRILDALREHGAFDRTIIIVTGDHGEEFMERGQTYHAGAMNDFQGRPVLWLHFPNEPVAPVHADELTSHIDLVPTLLDVLGFDEDVLRTQGESLLHPRAPRPALLTSEKGYFYAYYNALVTKDYITRWRNAPGRFRFSGVERRDGQRVVGDAWLSEARAVYPGAAREYEILPDPAGPLVKFAHN